MNVPTSTTCRAPRIPVSIVMKVPCSGPFWKITRSGKRSAVSAIRSRSSASGGVEWATR